MVNDLCRAISIYEQVPDGKLPLPGHLQLSPQSLDQDLDELKQHNHYTQCNFPKLQW